MERKAMLLILMRSGECAALESGKHDSDRCLTENGIKDAVSVAIFLSSLGVEPKFILSSPFQRTKKTAEILSEHLPETPPVTLSQYIMPGAGVEELMRSVCSISDLSQNEWGIAVGHEPDIGNAVKELLGLQNEAVLPMEPGSVVGLNVRCDGGRPVGHLIFLFSPRSLRTIW